MYHGLVRRRTAQMFHRLTSGDWRSAVAGLSDDVRHVFPGDHPLGGERHTRKAASAWFERLDRLFPGHDFEVHRVISRGWPWSTWVAVQWTAQLSPRKGSAYTNDGAHWIHLRWGKVTYLHAYLDTQRVAAACREMADHGVEEAAELPIVD